MNILPLRVGAVQMIPYQGRGRSARLMQVCLEDCLPGLPSYFFSAFLAVSDLVVSAFGLSSFFAAESPFAEEPAEDPEDFLA